MGGLSLQDNRRYYLHREPTDMRKSFDGLSGLVQKTVYETIPNKTTNYYYAGDYVYRNDTLEFISHPEGRLRPVRIDTTQAISIANLKYIYDYFLKDHLGSVRDVLTTEQQDDIYAASLETAAAAKEDALFSNVSSTAAPVHSGMTNDVNNLQASKLNGAINITGNKRVGPSIVLKVMTGDTISISTWSWYTGAVQPAPTGLADIATELLPLLTGGVAAGGGTHGGSIPSTVSDPLLSSNLTNFLTNDRPYESSRPKAFLNWMVVDEEFAGVSSPNHMNAVQIPACNPGDTLKQVVGPANMVIRRNGWIYIYLSNESAQDVYFDNLVVNLKHGPLVEQKDYYAFGMEIPGLSTQALKRPYDQNRYRYNGIEYDSAFGLDYYEAKYRDYDAQIGRFTQIDPKVESAEGWSVYSGMLDNPVLNSDPLGDSSGVGNWLDSRGWGFREPTKEQWEDHPIRSALGEVGYLGASLFGLPQAEQAARTVTDPDASTTDKTLAVVQTGLATSRGEGGEGKPMEGGGEIQAPRGAANPKTSQAINIGKQAHNNFKNDVTAKEGWTANPRLTDPTTGKTVIPDAVSPSGHPVELKPNTPSGRTKGASQLPKYERATGNNGRVVYYDPLKWLKDNEVKK